MHPDNAGIRFARLDQDRLAKGANRLFMALLRTQNLAEAGVSRGITGCNLNGAPDRLLCHEALALPLMYKRQTVQRFGIIGLDRQNLLAKRLGFNQPTLVEKLNCLEQPLIRLDGIGMAAIQSLNPLPTLISRPARCSP